MFPPEAGAAVGGLPNGDGLLMAADAKRPVGGAAGAAAAVGFGGAAPKTLVSGLGMLPKMFPLGAVVFADVWKGLTTGAAVDAAAAKPPPNTEVDELLVVDAVELVATKGAAAAVVVGATPALRLLKALEKEKALPGTALLDVAVALVVAGVAAGGMAAGLAAAVVVTVAAGAAVVVIGSVLTAVSPTVVAAAVVVAG